MHSYSDVSSADDIKQDGQRGTRLIDGRTLYLPLAYGYMHDGKPHLLASMTRFTLMKLNGRKVLMRDDALRVFRGQNKLYDYGILVKENDQADIMLDLRYVGPDGLLGLCYCWFYYNEADRVVDAEWQYHTD